ncbi:MAG: hypothetical protein WBW37_03695 [Methyloceanibacter sp.]|jgi:hypothetical protein
MTPAYLHIDARPTLPSRGRAIAVMAALGMVTGLISSLPSPLPDIRLSDPDVLINARAVPLHAGIAFGAMVAGVLWLWVNRDSVKCLLAIMLTLAGWLAAVNTANDVINTIQESSLFGTIEGAKAYREMLGWMTGGLLAGAVGAGLTAFGTGIAATAIRRPEAWMLIVLTGAIAGLLLYPAAFLDTIVLLFVPWQAAVAAAIGFGLSWRNRFKT